MLPEPLQPVLRCTASAHELRAAITTTRVRLHEVLEDRQRSAGTPVTWAGPHRQRYDEDTTDLLAAGRLLDHVLRDLLTALDAELEAATG